MVFDLDGTLVESAPDLMRALNHALAGAGRPAVSLEAVRGMIGDGMVTLVQRGFEATGGLPGDRELGHAVSACLEFYSAHSDKNSFLYPGVEEALEILRQRGLRLAICTNKPQAPAVDLLRSLGIYEQFEAVVGADTFEFRKPDSRMLLATLDRLKCSPSDAIMVGDSRNDALVAQGAEVKFVLVTFGYLNASQEELAPAAVIDSFSELVDLVLSWGVVVGIGTDRL